jgi:hypothetical protein
MYMPVGLTCGHLFCSGCVKRAVGCTGSLTRAKKDACCPSCRQTGVFAGAVELYELNNLIRRKVRSPGAWQSTPEQCPA